MYLEQYELKELRFVVNEWMSEQVTRMWRLQEKRCAGRSLGHSEWTLRNNIRPPRSLLSSANQTMTTPRSAFRSLSRASQLINARRPWTCSACRSGIPRRFHRGLATTPEAPKKPFYVTTPIFYVNAGEFLKTAYKLNGVFLKISSYMSSPPCRTFLHHGHRRYPQTMAGSTRQRC